MNRWDMNKGQPGNRNPVSRVVRVARRGTALLLACLLVLVQTAPALAEQGVYFVAAEEKVLPLSDADMPFWDGGYLYISGSIFTSAIADGAAVKNLGVSLTQNQDQDAVTLYKGKESLDFVMGVPFAVDPDGEIHYPGAVWKNGRVFVPAHLTASYFHLLYSVLEVEHGNLIWFRNPSFRFQEEAFVDAVSSQLDTCYQAYLDAKKPPSRTEQAELAEQAELTEQAELIEQTEPTEQTEREPAPQRPLQEQEQDRDWEREQTEEREQERIEEREQTQNPLGEPEENQEPESTQEPGTSQETEPEVHCDIFLCLEAGENTASLLETLDGAGVQAAFFCDRDFLEQQGGLVRRMVSEGYSIGLYLSPGSAQNPAGSGEELTDGTVDATNETADTAGETADTTETPTPTEVPDPRTADHIRQEAAACNALLWRDACCHARLAMLDSDAAGIREAARSVGLVCLVPDWVPSGTQLRTASRLDELREQRGRVTIWLDSGVEANDLAPLLSAADDAGDRFFALTETSF